jgi:nucleotide-binding universal stress UspA family protein
MFGTILVGTDGSGSASRAVELAARLAEKTGSTLLAVSVYSEPGREDPLNPSKAGGIDVARGLLEDVQKHYGSRVKLETLAVAGDPADAMITLAEERAVGLIITGDRGMSGAKRVMGSVPNTISHHAPCHVLIAHTADGQVGEIEISKVLIATDGSDTATKAVQTGLAVADALGASAVLMTASDKEADGQKILAAANQAVGRELEGIVLGGSPADAILNAGASIGADLVVTGSRGMTGARRLLGSVPNSVSHHIDRSMFIAKTSK